MITLHIEAMEFYNDESNEFETYDSAIVKFEYSLAAVAEWEAKWTIPFLNTELAINDPKFIDFCLCMTLDKSLKPEQITPSIALGLSDYIKEPQTATTFSDRLQDSDTKSGKVYSSEEIYALMFMNSVPIELENVNLNRLLVILKIISIYSNPPKKMSKQEVLNENRSLNEKRKKELNTRG